MSTTCLSGLNSHPATAVEVVQGVTMCLYTGLRLDLEYHDLLSLFDSGLLNFTLGESPALCKAMQSGFPIKHLPIDCQQHATESIMFGHRRCKTDFWQKHIYQYQILVM